MKEEAKSHLQRAERFLEEARYLAAGKYWGAVVNRTYYAMFHAATAVLLEDGIERSSHKALISAFGEEVAKKGRLDAKYHRFLIDAFEWRSESDYFADPGETEEEATESIHRAEELLTACRGLVK